MMVEATEGGLVLEAPVPVRVLAAISPVPATDHLTSAPAMAGARQAATARKIMTETPRLQQSDGTVKTPNACLYWTSTHPERILVAEKRKIQTPAIVVQEEV